MEIILAIIILVFCILQIILFFKLWGMTNNVKKLTYLLFDSLRTEDFKVGERLYNEDRDTFVKVLKKNEDGTYRCQVEGYLSSETDGLAEADLKTSELHRVRL